MTIKKCVTCKKNSKCEIPKQIKNLPLNFFCSEWRLKPYKATLIDPGQRLAGFHLDCPEKVKEYKRYKPTSEKISLSLLNSHVTVIAEIDSHIALIKMRLNKSPLYCYINKKGLL